MRLLTLCRVLMDSRTAKSAADLCAADDFLATFNELKAGDAETANQLLAAGVGLLVNAINEQSIRLELSRRTIGRN